VREISNTPVWLQAGWHLALAAQIPAEQKNGCPRLTEAICRMQQQQMTDD
jgi:hypothetical protein